MIYIKKILLTLTICSASVFFAAEHYVLVVKETTSNSGIANFIIYTPVYEETPEIIQEKIKKFTLPTTTLTLQNYPLNFIFYKPTSMPSMDEELRFTKFMTTDKKTPFDAKAFFETIKKKPEPLLPYEAVINKFSNFDAFKIFLQSKSTVVPGDIEETPLNAGILPYTITEDGKILFLMGNQGRGWSDFGGVIDPEDNSTFSAAERECAEESGIIFENLKKEECISFITTGYGMYLVRIDYIDPKLLNSIKNFRANTSYAHNEINDYEWFELKNKTLNPEKKSPESIQFYTHFNNFFVKNILKKKTELQKQGPVPFALWAKQIAILFYIRDNDEFRFIINNNNSIFTRNILLKSPADILEKIKEFTPEDNIVAPVKPNFHLKIDVPTQIAFCAVHIKNSNNLKANWKEIDRQTLENIIISSRNMAYMSRILNEVSPKSILSFLMPRSQQKPPAAVFQPQSTLGISPNQSSSIITETANATANTNQPTAWSRFWNNVAYYWTYFLSGSWLPF